MYCDKGQHCIKMNFKLEVNLKKIFQRQNMNCDIRNIRTDSESRVQQMTVRFFNRKNTSKEGIANPNKLERNWQIKLDLLPVMT